MSRLRICQLVTELRPAGAERGVFELATRLDRRRFDVQVAALRGGQVADWLARAGLKVTVLGVRGKWDAVKLPALARFLRRQRVELLHTHLFHADLAGRLAAGPAGVGHLVHTVWTAEGRWRPWQFAFARLLAGRCERMICLAESVRDFHARKSGLPRAAYAVIPWGVDAAMYARDEEARRRLRTRWGVGRQTVLLAYVGRLESYKGIDALLAAMERAVAGGAGGPWLELVVAGDGPRRQAVESFIARGEGGARTRLLGFVPNDWAAPAGGGGTAAGAESPLTVRAVLSAADIFVMPSHWEGWGLALGEAMAAGLPAVGSDVPAVRELIADGQTGLLVPPRDPGALAEALRRLAGDAELRRRMGAAARHRIAERFGLSSAIAAHEALYEQVASRPGGGA